MSAFETILKQFDYFNEYAKMSLEQKEIFQKKLMAFALKKLEKQKSSFFQKEERFHLDPIKPDYYSLDYAPLGEEALRKGEAAIVVLAGGMATRLKYPHPKGCYGVTNIKEKSLFQLLLEKIRAAEKKYAKQFDIAIMTSQNNNAEAFSFFEKNNFFGLKKEQVNFFLQEELPFLDENGKWICLDGNIITSPDGNGGVFENLKRSGLLKKFKEKNIKHIQIAPIDNPLFDPFDPVFIGFHVSKKHEASFIVIEKENEESMGVVGLNNKKVKVVEYVHLTKEEKRKFKYFNTSLFCTSIDFIEKSNFNLPLHQVKKSFRHQGKEFFGFKSEMFIFDILDSIDNPGVICFPQNLCYSPLKNFSGKDSLATVREDLYQKDRRIFEEITKQKPPDAIFELSPSFYYLKEELKEILLAQSQSGVSYIDS